MWGESPYILRDIPVGCLGFLLSEHFFFCKNVFLDHFQMAYVHITDNLQKTEKYKKIKIAYIT